MIMGLRRIAALGLVAIAAQPSHASSRLIADRRDGAARAIRSSPPTPIGCNAIAWVLLALQLVSIAIAAIGKAISTPAHPCQPRCRLFDQRLARRAPVFVLARVFAEGTLMREDLEGTV